MLAVEEEMELRFSVNSDVKLTTLPSSPLPNRGYNRLSGETINNIPRKLEASAIPSEYPKEVSYQNKGYALYLLKRYEEALRAYEQAIHEDPEDEGPYVGKALILRELGRHEELLAVYEQAIQRVPHPLAKARLLRQVGRDEEAECLEQQTRHAKLP